MIKFHSVETWLRKRLGAHKRSMKGGNPTKTDTNLIKNYSVDSLMTKKTETNQSARSLEF